MRRMALRHSHDPHLGNELDAVHARDRLAHMGDEALEVGGARLSVVDDEVGVLLGYRGAPDAKALEAGRLDEARGVVSRRVGEHRAAAPLADRLRGPTPVEEIERAVRAHDHALQAAVAHQEVAPEPDPVDGHRGRERAQELCELDAIARIEENLGRAPDVPGGVPAQGLIAAHPLAELRGDGEAHRELLGGRSAASAPGSACATALMLPAPMARMTSPSEITSLSAAASSSTFSTNSGSSTPRLRTARQMARPSAPAIGASPAAYTSVTASASAPESTLPKSSIRSRVRV